MFNSCKKEDGQEPYILDDDYSAQLLIEVSGFENSDGNLAIAINNNSAQFASNTECYIDTIIYVLYDDMVVAIDGIEPGVYAISIFHDEDEDGELDVGFLGIPEEGFGFSNNPSIGFSQPSFNDCSFEIKDNQSIAVPINLVYL